MFIKLNKELYYLAIKADNYAEAFVRYEYRLCSPLAHYKLLVHL